MNNQTLEKLRQMRLFGMHDAFKTSLENTLKEQMTQDQFVFHLVGSEWDNRRNRAIARAVKAAQSRYNASLEDMDYTYERGLDRNQVERLAAMEFVRDRKDLFYYRPYRNRQKLSGHRPWVQSVPGELPCALCKHRQVNEPPEDIQG